MKTAKRLTLWAICGAMFTHQPVLAQNLRGLLPNGVSVPTISIDPREPRAGARLLAVLDAVSQFGTGLEGRADLGHSFPLLVLSGVDAEHSVLLGLQAGVFARFRMTSAKRDLVSTDWVFAIPIVVKRGQDWFRFGYRHVSSHLGDEYIEKFNATRAEYTRDGLGITAYHRVFPGMGLYGGTNIAINVDPNDAKRVQLQGGMELSHVHGRGKLRFDGGIDVLLDQDAFWSPRINIESGVTLTPNNRRRLRFMLGLAVGKSPQGEFRRQDETVIEAGFLIEM